MTSNSPRAVIAPRRTAGGWLRSSWLQLQQQQQHREEQQLVRDLERACERQQQLARGAEMTTLDLAEMMEQQMSGEDAMEVAFSLGMPRV